MNIPDDTLKKSMLKFAKSLTTGKLYKPSDLGENGEARFKLLEKYQLWLWFIHEIDIIVFVNRSPIFSTWNFKTKDYGKYETIKQLRKS